MTHERFKNKSDRPSPAGRRPCSRLGAVPGMHMPTEPKEDRVGWGGWCLLGAQQSDLFLFLLGYGWWSEGVLRQQTSQVEAVGARSHPADR